MGLGAVEPVLDLAALRARIEGIEERLEALGPGLLADQGVRIIAGSGRLVGPHEVAVTPNDGGAVEVLPADTVVLATGSRPADPRLRPHRRRPGAHHPRRLPAARAARRTWS